MIFRTTISRVQWTFKQSFSDKCTSKIVSGTQRQWQNHTRKYNWRYFNCRKLSNVARNHKRSTIKHENALVFVCTIKKPWKAFSFVVSVNQTIRKRGLV